MFCSIPEFGRIKDKNLTRCCQVHSELWQRAPKLHAESCTEGWGKVRCVNETGAHLVWSQRGRFWDREKKNLSAVCRAAVIRAGGRELLRAYFCFCLWEDLEQGSPVAAPGVNVMGGKR